MEFILERGLEIYLIILVGAVGIGFKLLESEAYKRYLIQTDNISGSRNKYLKQLKLKYDNAVRMNKHFGNVQAFTQRFYYQFRYLGMRLQTMGALSSFLVWTAVALGVIFTYFSFSNEYSLKAMIMPAYAALMVLLGYQMALSGTRCGEKREELFAKVADYLENVYPKSMIKESSAETQEDETIERSDDSLPVAQIAATKERRRKTPEKKKEEKRILTAEEAYILEELLKEYRG